MIAARQSPYLVEEEKHILRTLLYFDIFDYPLTEDEIVCFSQSPVAFSMGRVLQHLVAQRIIFQFQNFFSLHDEPALVMRRLKGNALAEKKMKTARAFSRMISLFPFVRAVMLSGSISKGYMDERSDIDYFIITEANRLWIVRTGLAIFRRLFLFNSHKNFCTNYFVDSEHLEIREQNIFTAIELCTIKAIFGFPTIERFNAANAWTSAFLPNFALRNDALAGKGFFFTGLIEKIFSFKAIDRCNTWLMTQSIRYWKRRYGSDIDPLDFEIAFRSTTGVSRSHPQFFQKKVLTYYAQKIKDFEFKHGIDLGL